jgi:hypothetical protein
MPDLGGDADLGWAVVHNATVVPSKHPLVDALPLTSGCRKYTLRGGGGRHFPKGHVDYLDERSTTSALGGLHYLWWCHF